MTENSEADGEVYGASEGQTDLLGDPMREYRDPRGRKKLKVSNELRDRVAVLREDLDAKGDEVMSGLGWLRKAAAGVAAFLGLDQAPIRPACNCRKPSPAYARSSIRSPAT